MKYMKPARSGKAMRKMGLMALLVGATAALSTGCSSSAYDLYKSAEEKTAAADTAVYDMAIKMESEIDTSQMNEEQLKAINYLKQFEFKGKTTTDRKKDAVISEAWLNLGGIGFDFTYYGNGEKQYIKYPVLKKYIDLKTLMDASGAAPSTADAPVISENTKESLARIWDQLATKESVQAAGDVIIATDAGDIKAKHLVVEVPGDAIKKALTDSQKIILMDPGVQDLIKAQMKKAKEEAAKNGTAATDTSAFNADNVVLLTDQIEIESYTLSCDVDADGYLVEETTEIVMSGFGKDSPMKRMTFRMNTVYSSLNKPVELNFPEIGADEVFTIDELNQQMPSVFKDLIQ